MTTATSATSDEGGEAAIVSRPVRRSTADATSSKSCLEASAMSTTMGFGRMHDAGVHGPVRARWTGEL
jgi:hypothetical protein